MDEQRRVGIKDVARAAGVSVGTVSNVLNRPESVGTDTLERVQAAIEALGFIRNETARQLRAGRGRAIGLVVIDAANPFFADVARGVEDEVDASGGVVLLGNSGGDPRRERRYLELFEETRVRGVLIAPCGDGPPPLERLTRLGIPVVFIDRFPDGTPYSSVTVDDVAGGRLATQHLLDLGHRHIAYAGGPSTLRQVRDRRQGAEEVVDAARAAGATDARLLAASVADLTTGAGRAFADELASAPAQLRPTGVFAANDLVAIGLLQGLLRHGVRVPEEIALVGYDDIDFAVSAAVPLTSVRQPREDLGRTGAQLLQEQIAARESGRRVPHRQVQFRPELVVRRSSGDPLPVRVASTRTPAEA